jgi:hypothetical protein
MRFVTCEPTIRPLAVKISAVNEKKKDVVSAASSPMISIETASQE